MPVREQRHTRRVHASTICPGCGLELPPNRWTVPPREYASSECVELRGEVVGFELEHVELVRDYHQLLVDAYLAQHAPPSAGDPSISVPFSLVGLHLTLDRGIPGIKVRDIHQRMRRDLPTFEPPQRRGEVTVFDVAAAGVMVDSTSGHASAMRRWAASVWNAWAEHHTAVRALTDEITAAINGA